MAVELLNIDCIEYMKTLPDKLYDLAIVDPPYGISVNMNMGKRKGKRNKHKVKNWDDQPPPPEYFNELFRVSKRQIIWGGNNFDLPRSQYFCIWDKAESMYGRDFAECEYAWVSGGGQGFISNHQIKQTESILLKSLLNYINGFCIGTPILAIGF